VDDLTGQEAQIARLASDGLTSPEISTRLFLSPCTVGWHLRKVFAKLGISPCRRLRGRCPALARVALPAWPGRCLRAGGPARPPPHLPGPEPAGRRRGHR